MIRLNCTAQNYAWGRLANTSEVAALHQAGGNDVDDTKPYAELWMGTHPSGPSYVVSEGVTLKEWVEKHPEALGEVVTNRFGKDLPFLFKVLSVETALSIQSHPDKALAEQLHAERPEVYKDDNHKPEMALAITDFEALCGFVSYEELKDCLNSVPELREAVGQAAVDAFCALTDPISDRKGALQAAFTALMTCPPGRVAACVNNLVQRLESESKSKSLSVKEKLALRLNAQYPADVGVLSAFFLNLVSLKEGEAIYLAANEPHAYVSGQLMEVMATSDNVIRAGLTPKLRDTEVLCTSLNYTQGLPEVLKGDPLTPYIKRYQPPFDEFELYTGTVPAGVAAALPEHFSPLLLVVTAGDGASSTGQSVQRGDIYFVPAGIKLALTAGAHCLSFHYASCNSRVFSAKAAETVAKAEEAVAA